MRSPEDRHRFGRRVRRLLVASALAAVAVAGGGMALVWAVRWAPLFYRQALAQAMDSALAAEARDELSNCILDIYNRRWEGARFATCLRQEALNAFLDLQAAEGNPPWWPPPVRQVRLTIAPGRLQVGMQYQLGPLATVVWAEGEMYLTPHNNELALRLHRARLGAIPLPPSAILREIGRCSQQAGLIVRWSEAAQDPVMLIRPANAAGDEDQPQIVLEQLALEEGAVLLAGRWVHPAQTSADRELSMEANTRQSSDGGPPSAAPVDGVEGLSSAHPTLQARGTSADGRPPAGNASKNR